jgi:glutamate-1-semialdehyde 2,1-aminomutase
MPPAAMPGTLPMQTERSRALLAEALRLIPGGVNSPVRAFTAVGGEPLFLARGAGAHVWDVDGNRFIDYLGSWGPLIAGHAHPKVLAAIAETAAHGTSFGAPTELEVRLARKVVSRVPSIEKIRMVNSGTEATLSAIRLARAHTGRDRVVKVEGCYHGHVDALLVSAGSGVATLSIPGTPGIPDAVAAQTTVVPFNDLDALRAVLAAQGREIACVILEPNAGNMGVVPPRPGYLAGVRELTRAHGVVFILDEVMTGFRVHAGGAQVLYGIEPDLTTLGKVIGGGLPVGAYGGRAEIMDKVSPQGPVYQAGTLSGNPLAMSAGLANLELTEAPGFYARLETLSARLADGLAEGAAAAGVPVTFHRVGSMQCAFFTAGPVSDWKSASISDTRAFAAYFRALLERGVYIAPSQYEALFVSAAHTEADIDATIAAAREAFTAAARTRSA